MNNKLLALIIEDDEDLAIIFEAALQEADYDTEVIQDGQLALDRLAQTVPAIVVLDLHLPSISGVEILQHIRSDEQLSGVRVMLATADAQMADNITDLADVVLLKPVSYDQLTMLATRLRNTSRDS